MKVFLSYASQDRASAELVVESLTARGHDVFFDRDSSSLPPGATFEDRIEQAIAQASAFVFLISQHSVTSGCFTLTELTIAHQKWPRANGRVLPVMLEEVDLGLVPAYLKSVTILQPAGNIAAEVAIAVDAMRRWKPARLMQVSAAAATVVTAVLTYVFWPAPDLVINAYNPVRQERGFFDTRDRYSFAFEVVNSGSRAGKIISAQIQTEPSAAIEVVSQEVSFSAETPTVIASGGVVKSDNIIILTETSPPSFMWKVCVTRDTGETNCSEPHKWMPEGSFAPQDAFQVDPDVSAKAVLLAVGSDGFFVATRNPGRLLLVDTDGTVIRQVDLGGEPTALLAQDGDLLIGLRGPDAVVRLDPVSFEMKERVPIRFPSHILGAFDAPVSSTPVSIAKGDGRVWILTRGGASATGLIHLSEALSDPTVPSWFEEIAYDLDSLHLSSDGKVVWGAVTDISPASLYRLSRDKLKVYSGHDWTIASCATDILPLGDAILVPDCTGTIQRVKFGEDDLTVEKRIGTAFGYDSSMSTWTELHLRRNIDGRIAAFTINGGRGGAMGLSRTVATRLEQQDGPGLIFEVAEARIVDLEFYGPILMVILESEQGKRETLALDIGA